MKTMTTIKTLLSVAVLVAATQSASAAPIGTAAGTAIDNTASITYNVGGNIQPAIGSSAAGNTNGAGTPTTFVVDKKIDLSVTGAGTDLSVSPGTPAGATTELSYTLLNEGNSTELFGLSTTDNLAFGVGDEFNSSGCTITSPAALPVSVASGDTVDVKVQCTIPATSATVVNGAKTLVDVLATVSGVTATLPGTADTVGCISGTPGPTCVTDVVFADGTGTIKDTGARKGDHSATSTYVINSAALTVKKTQVATKMLINGADETTDVYHIPGSTIEYTITVVNSGTASATNIVLSDTVVGSLLVVGTPQITIAAAAATGVASGTSSSVASAPFTLAGGETATLVITATVK